MPVVSKTISNVTVPNDPSTPVVYGYVDFSMLLSEHYGKQIRQGNSFRLKGMQATLVPSSGLTDDFDVGMSCLVQHRYIPTTGNSREAWNLMFQQWKKQKLLAGKVGRYMKYDDFECAWSTSTAYHDATRTSTLYAGGMGDTTEEKVTLQGNSVAGNCHSLKDLYNSQQRRLRSSVDPFTGAEIKASKFNYDTPYPDEQSIMTSAVASAAVLSGSGLSNDMYHSSIAMNEIQEFPVSLNVLCGNMAIAVYVPSDDTAAQWADTCDVHIHYYIESWKPLVYRPRAKNPSKWTRKVNKGKSRGGRKSRKRSRR